MRFDLALGARLAEWEPQREVLARGFDEFLGLRFRYFFLRDLPAGTVGSLAIRQRWRLAVRSAEYESSGTAASDHAWQLFHRELAKLATHLNLPEQSKVRLADGGTNSEPAFLSFIVSFAGDAPEQALRTAIHLDTSFKEARYHLAKRLVVERQVEQAIQLMDDVLFLDEDRPRDFASELWRRNHLWEAREVLRYFCDREPEVASNCRMLASISLLLGGREEARTWAARALALDPADHRHWRLLGDVQRAIGEPEKAARFLRIGLEIKKDDPGLLESLSASLMEQGRLEESIQWLERAVYLEPKSETLASLAYALAQKGDLAAALDAITRAIEKDQGNPRLHILAGDIMVRRGDAMAAQSFFHQAEALSPGAKIQFEGGNLV